MVVFVITGSLMAALSVFLSVLIVDMCLLAMIPLLGLTFNNVIVVHMLASVALSVLYSLLVTMDYLLMDVPVHLTRRKQESRKYKARLAISRTSSSVLHGIIATLIALFVVYLVIDSYVFSIFVKIWFGTASIGMLNAYLLVPTILSFVGPVDPLTYR